MPLPTITPRTRPRTPLCLLLALACFAWPLHAAVYRCATPHGAVYTDIGCTGGQAVVLKPPVGSIAPLSAAEVARLKEIEQAHAARRHAIATRAARATRRTPVTRAGAAPAKSVAPCRAGARRGSGACRPRTEPRRARR